MSRSKSPERQPRQIAIEHLSEGEEMKKMLRALPEGRIDSTSDPEYFLIDDTDHPNHPGRVIKIPKRKRIPFVEGKSVRYIEISEYLEMVLYGVDSHKSLEEVVHMRDAETRQGTGSSAA